MKVRVTKCYLVQLLDEDGNEVSCEYVFGNKEDAKEAGKRLKSEYKPDLRNIETYTVEEGNNG